MHNLGLAIIHHVLVFGLAIMLAMELAMLRAGRIDVKRLGRLDGGYGLTATLVFAVGVARVIWGDKGWIFYQDNPFFWAKVATFVVIGLSSIAPTIAFVRWSRAVRADADFQPDAAAVKRVAGLVRVEVLLLFPLVGFAAAMARWTG